MIQDPGKRMDDLIEMIESHRLKYYGEDKQSISDAEYDLLEHELLDLEKAHPQQVRPHSSSFRVGGVVVDDHPSRAHSQPMLSLENAYTPVDLERFFVRTQALSQHNPAYTVELKIDGLSLAVIYERGIMTHAITRGDGAIGEDVTLNAKTIIDLPLHIPGWHDFEQMEVRGEVYLDRQNFERLNELRIEDGGSPFANPRNAAAGSLRMLNSAKVAKRRLRIFAYQVLGPWSTPLVSHMEAIKMLAGLGFPINPHNTLLHNCEDLLALIKRWSQLRDELAYETDGVVVKFDNRSLYDEMGYTSKFPKWAIAYKFAAEQALTQILKIEVQVGRTGVLTPVANFNAIQLAGTSVSRATLHNFDEITKKDIREGDWVLIEKGGDIIPKVLKVVVEKRSAELVPMVIPKHCPRCNGDTLQVAGEVAVRCVNVSCPAQLERRVTHFASRGGMDIQGLGKERVQQIVAAGLVSDLSSLFRLTSHQLLKLERMGDKSMRNLLGEIEKSKSKPFARLLFAVGIPMIGAKVATLLVDKFNSFDQLIAASKEEVAEIYGLGDKVAQALFSHLALPGYRRMFEAFRELGLSLEYVAPADEPVESPKPLAGRTMVITGSFSCGSRTKLTEMMKALGANVTGSVSKNTQLLLAGEKAGSKLAKANALGIEIVHEDWLIQWQNP